MSVAVTFPHGSYCEYSTCIGSTQVTCNMDAPVPVPVPTAYGMLVGDGLDSLRRIFTNVSRVAVVGSSGNLLFRGHGAEIDQHDIVIRMNGAGTASYERDVGSFTSIRVGFPDGLNDATRHGVVTPGETTVITQSGWAPGGSVVAFNLEWSRALVEDYLDGSHNPSAGFQALALAMAMSRDVGGPPPSAYGFGACPPCGRYYDGCDPDGRDSYESSDYAEAQGSDNGAHAFASERQARLAWAANGAIRLVEPSCDHFGHYPSDPPVSPPPLPTSPAPDAPSPPDAPPASPTPSSPPLSPPPSPPPPPPRPTSPTPQSPPPSPAPSPAPSPPPPTVLSHRLLPSSPPSLLPTLPAPLPVLPAPQIGAGIVASLFPHPSPSVAASAGGDGDVRSPSGNSVTGSLAWAIQLVRDAASLLGLAVLCIVAPLGACGLIRLHMRWPAQRRDRRWIQFEANYGEATEQDVAAAPHEGGE